MKIPKEKLGQFGISIKVNRKERLRKYSGASWTQKGFCDGICSEPSFVNIEKGKPGRFIDNYEKMAEKLGMRIAYDPDVDKKIDNYTKHLYKAIEYYDLKKTEKYCDKLIALLEGFKDCLWYGDLYRVVLSQKRYYTKCKYLDNFERKFFAEMLDEFSFYWNEILKSYIFNSAYYDFETMEYAERFIQFKIEDSNETINKLNSLMYYFVQENTSKFSELFDKVRKDWNKKKNYIRLVDAYNLALLFNSYFDLNEVDDVANKLNEFIMIIAIPPMKLIDIYYNLGVAYFELKQYEKTIEMMEKCYQYDVNKTRLTFIYIGHSQRMLNKAVLIPYYSESELNNFSNDAYEIYKYFTALSEFPDKEIEKVLMSNVLPPLNNEDEIVIRILREELELILENTKHYKNLSIFDKKTKELTARVR